MTIVLTITDRQLITAQRLCSEGVGRESVNDSILTVSELIQYSVDTYLNNKSEMYLNQDREALSQDQVDIVMGR
jgi:hypothetical protein